MAQANSYNIHLSPAGETGVLFYCKYALSEIRPPCWLEVQTRAISHGRANYLDWLATLA